MTFLKTELERQMAAHLEAKELIEVHGHAAYDLARQRAWHANQAPRQADYWWCVTGIIMRRLGVERQADATFRHAGA